MIADFLFNIDAFSGLHFQKEYRFNFVTVKAGIVEKQINSVLIILK